MRACDCLLLVDVEHLPTPSQMHATGRVNLAEGFEETDATK